ncbi:HAD family hydrolase [Patescibacteria group bacterium]|nr:HAD family hydrolase [Patescibacteria group bacterium]
MIKNIIFDWSGVVKDCIDDHFNVVNRMLKEHGLPSISSSELKKEWRQPYMAFYSKYFPKITLEEEKELYKRAIAKSPKAKAYPGICQLIKSEKNKRLFVASGDYPFTILKEIEDFQLSSVFDDVLIDLHDKEKAVSDLLKKYNLELKETLIIGDTNHEIEVGKKLGIKTGAVTWGFCSEDFLKSLKPDFLIHNIEELKDAISSVS